MANQGFTTATDFADYLVKEKKLTFFFSSLVENNFSEILFEQQRHLYIKI